MENEIRIFVALKIEPNAIVLNQLNEFKTTLKNDRIRWVNQDNFHLTLRFIGNTTREQLYNLVDSFEIIAKQFHPFQLNIEGAGYFQTKENPRALFLKIINSVLLSDLNKEIEKSVVNVGFHEELKPFRPHLTLGRIKQLDSRTRFYSIIEKLEDIKYQKVKVSEFILYRSILKPDGSIYKPIKKFILI